MIFKNIEFYARGKRSLVFTAIAGKIKVAIKVSKQGINAKNRIENEGKFLSVLNKHGIGPKLIFYDDDLLIYEFVEGKSFLEYLEKEKNKKNLKKILKQILGYCRTMDKLNIEKKEMTRPFKNVILKKGKPVLIDFERCRKTRRPSNVSQFCQFLTSKSCGLCFDRKKLIKNAKEYMKDYSEKNYFSLLDFFGF